MFAGECSFERDMCGWTNHTDTAPTTNLVGRVGSAPRDSLTWRLASVVSRPANLQDHTYRAPTGYIFFDIFNQNSVQNPVLRSSTIPALEGQAERCLSFWFAPFGRGESSTLSVFQAPEAPPAGDDGATNGNAAAPRTLLWRLSTRRMDTSRPDWRYGQVKVAAEAPFKNLDTQGYSILRKTGIVDGGIASSALVAIPTLFQCSAPVC
ncbi:hypothetical protein HPB51_008103 [Rhipicephalus microplus]|uniref:MAM domain-containing protein n=1 Tax=Rhipicephalus microplus TaxID=6941 RepID=A0A9J6ENX6_RHIMP|nr:hypothetical protein HPB51_008103 [Rhipicephalus microplus]